MNYIGINTLHIDAPNLHIQNAVLQFYNIKMQ